MVISSLVVEALPQRADEVARRLPAFAGVEVHDVRSNKVVITIERPTVDESHDVADEIALLDGVLNVNLIYLNFEDDRTIYPDGV